MRLRFGSVDQVKRAMLTNANWHHPIQWEPKWNKKVKEGHILSELGCPPSPAHDNRGPHSQVFLFGLGITLPASLVLRSWNLTELYPFIHPSIIYSIGSVSLENPDYYRR